MASLAADNYSNGELVADASTVINLIATGCASTIVAALPWRVVVPDVIVAELASGRSRGHPHADHLQELVDVGVITVVSLRTAGTQYFEDLVVGPALMTLDDGEAATIAYAAEHAAVALLDDRKATRICLQRFPALRIACTVDVLAHPTVETTLGRDQLAEAVYKALQYGRMHVLPQNLDYIVKLIGAARASECPSLPKSVRLPE